MALGSDSLPNWTFGKDTTLYQATKVINYKEEKKNTPDPMPDHLKEFYTWKNSYKNAFENEDDGNDDW